MNEPITELLSNSAESFIVTLVCISGMTASVVANSRLLDVVKVIDIRILSHITIRSFRCV